MKKSGSKLSNAFERVVCIATPALILAAFSLQPSASAQAAAAAQTPPLKTLPLWPAGAPGALGKADDDIPTLAVYLPSSNPTHTAVIIAPGGGYQHLSMEKEGSDVAHWLNAHGVAGFVLKYRLGPKYHHPIEIGDAQRAIRMVRAAAHEYDVDPTKVGMLGFSAGGSLTATTGTLFTPANPSAPDPIDRQPDRPDFLVLAYPVITLEDPYAHTGSRKYLLGDTPDPALVQLLSAEKHVTANTPPTFLFSTTDDHTVPIMNSVLFYSALVAAKVDAELHIYQHGPHGVGLAPGFPDLKGWPDLLATWMRARGFMAPSS